MKNWGAKFSHLKPILLSNLIFPHTHTHKIKTQKPNRQRNEMKQINAVKRFKMRTKKKKTNKQNIFKMWNEKSNNLYWKWWQNLSETD